MWRYLHLNFRCIYYHSMYLSKVNETLFFSDYDSMYHGFRFRGGNFSWMYTSVFNKTGNIADQRSNFLSFLMFGLPLLVRFHHIYIYKLVQRYLCELPTIASVNEPS